MIYVAALLLLCLALLSVRAARSLPIDNKNKVRSMGGRFPLGTALQTDMYRRKRPKTLFDPMTQAEMDHINTVLELQQKGKP
jgi:hypothetical protein